MVKKESKNNKASNKQKPKEKLKSKGQQFPDWWWNLLGSWKDDRTPEEILHDIRSGTIEVEREPLK